MRDVVQPVPPPGGRLALAPVTLRARVTVVAAVVIGFLMVCGLVVGGQLTRMSREAEVVKSQLGPAALAAERLNGDIATMDRALLEYIASADRAALGPFVAARTHSARELETLAVEFATPGQFDDLGALRSRTASSRERWLTSVADPQIALVKEGKQSVAAEAAQSGTTDKAYYRLRRDALALSQGIDDERSNAFSTLLRMNQNLVTLLGLIGLALLGLIAATLLALRSQVLRPLDDLRRQVREVARSERHQHPIVPSGPPELEAVGSDSELMRQQLVAEIDEASAARAGLEQEVPVVAAIRATLTTPAEPTVTGVSVFGQVAAAEGVLAGDWWDCWTLEDGRVATVIADISGHGPAAGIAGLRTRDTITRLLDAGVRPPAVMAAAADLFFDTPDQFATAVITVLDPVDGTLTWSNAGHHRPWVISGTTSATLAVDLRLDRTGPLLSAIGGTWTCESTTLAPGQTLMMWTDGLPESHQGNGGQLGDEGVWELIQTTYRESGARPPDTPADLVNGLSARARLRATDWDRDDVTILALRRD